MRTIALLLALLGGAVPAAGAAEWENDYVEVPAFDLNAALGYGGRPAVADADGRIHLVAIHRLHPRAQDLLEVLQRVGPELRRGRVVLAVEAGHGLTGGGDGQEQRQQSGNDDPHRRIHPGVCGRSITGAAIT